MKCFTRVALCILSGDASLRILSTDASVCFFINVTCIAVANTSIRGFFFKSYHKFRAFNLFLIHLILFWIDELIHLYSIYLSSMNIEFHLWYENYRRHFQIYLQRKCLNFNYNFTEICSQGSNWLQVSTGSGNGLAPNRRETITRINADPILRRIYTVLGGNKITKSGRSFHWGLVHPVQLHFVWIHLKYSILYLKRCLSVPSHYQYWLQIIDIHPRAISQNISKIWWQFFMHLSMVNELISKPWTSWVSVS